MHPAAPLGPPFRFPRDVPRLEASDDDRAPDVVLRAPLPEDAVGVVEQCRDPVSLRWTTVPVDYDAAMARDFLTKTIPSGWETGANHVFAIECDRPDGTRGFGGTLALERQGDDRFEIAFGAHPGARGRGVMTTAVRLLLDHGFDHLGAETVIWWAHRGNWPSRRLAWREGFTILDGAVPAWLPQRGVRHDAWVGSLRREDAREPRHPWRDAVRLTDGVVLLRPLVESDLDRLAEACGDAEAQRYLPFLPSPYERGDAERLLDRSRGEQAAGRAVWWTVVDPADESRFLGTVCLPRSDDTGGELGYWAHPDARGRGVVTAAARLALDHAFDALGWDRAYVRIHPDNAGSLRVAERLGFSHAVLLRAESHGREGRHQDAVRMDLLASGHRQAAAGSG